MLLVVNVPTLRHDWAYYYDRIKEMDACVGKILKELDDSGEAKKTIVFYYSDHGGVLARSKRYLYDTGTHVPFILRIPEKYKHLWTADEPGNMVDRLISFVEAPRQRNTREENKHIKETGTAPGEWKEERLTNP